MLEIQRSDSDQSELTSNQLTAIDQIVERLDKGNLSEVNLRLLGFTGGRLFLNKVTKVIALFRGIGQVRMRELIEEGKQIAKELEEI